MKKTPPSLVCYPFPAAVVLTSGASPPTALDRRAARRRALPEGRTGLPSPEGQWRRTSEIDRPGREPGGRACLILPEYFAPCGQTASACFRNIALTSPEVIARGFSPAASGAAPPVERTVVSTPLALALARSAATVS